VPLYDYQCKQCQKITEVRHGFKDTYDQPCPACGGTLARVFNPAGIVFKGSGFYITDSRKGGGGGGSGDSSAPTPAPAATPAPAESKKSDAA
jgi:putative FmdB family regulatory protein